MTENFIWCSLCNQRPADGTLEVLFEGHTQTTKFQACQVCVMSIPDEGWLNEKNLDGKPVNELAGFQMPIPEHYPKMNDMDFSE